MKSAKFPEVNTKLIGEHIPNCENLHVFNDGEKSISLWKASLKDRIKILFTGKIWLWVFAGHTAPPVCVDANYPFKVERK